MLAVDATGTDDTGAVVTDDVVSDVDDNSDWDEAKDGVAETEFDLLSATTTTNEGVVASGSRRSIGNRLL
jgi:hypothetical protein